MKLNSRNKTEKITLLIHSGIVITMGPDRKIFEDGAVAVDRGRIVELGNTVDQKARFKGEEEIDASGMAVMPGLVNLHFHTDNFSRGVGEHLNLENWLYEQIEKAL